MRLVDVHLKSVQDVDVNWIFGPKMEVHRTFCALWERAFDMMILNFGLEFHFLDYSVPQMSEKYLILSINFVTLYTDNSKFFHIRPLAPWVPCGVQTLPTMGEPSWTDEEPLPSSPRWRQQQDDWPYRDPPPRHWDR